MSAKTQPFPTDDYRMDVDIAEMLPRLFAKLATLGGQPAPPLTRRERCWWAWQMAKRGELRSVWAYTWTYNRAR